jgi:DNA polymerase III alpha subunit (gram-positive type)
VKPDCPVSAGAQRVHGLSNAELEEADPFDVVFNRFRSYCDTLRQATKCKTILLIAHNNFGFDQRLLQAQCRRFKVGHDWTDVLHGDTMQVLLDSYRFQRCECGLATIAKKCLKGRTQDHSAKGDVDLLIAVVNCMSNQCMMYDGLWELAQPLAVQLL